MEPHQSQQQQIHGNLYFFQISFLLLIYQEIAYILSMHIANKILFKKYTSLDLGLIPCAFEHSIRQLLGKNILVIWLTDRLSCS